MNASFSIALWMLKIARAERQGFFVFLGTLLTGCFSVFCGNFNLQLVRVSHTICLDFDNGAVAHLARAPRLHRGGREFDSLQLHHSYRKRSDPVTKARLQASVKVVSGG